MNTTTPTTPAQDVHEARHLLALAHAAFAHLPSATHWRALEAAMWDYQTAYQIEHSFTASHGTECAAAA